MVELGLAMVQVCEAAVAKKVAAAVEMVAVVKTRRRAERRHEERRWHAKRWRLTQRQQR